MTTVKRSRREQAADTRQRIVDTAYDAFCELGYRATTMALIGERAGVAVQTVYFVFGTKDALLQAVHDQTVLGREHPVPPPEQPWFRTMRTEPDPARAVAALVRGTAGIVARVAPMLPTFQAVVADPAGEIYARGEELRRQAMHDVAEALLRKGAPRPGLRRKPAGDVLVVLLGPEIYRTLVIELGWSQARWISWTTTMIMNELFA